MKKAGSCGLKQARYEISWRLCPCLCALVQNSLIAFRVTPVRPFTSHSKSSKTVFVSKSSKSSTSLMNSSASTRLHPTFRQNPGFIVLSILLLKLSNFVSQIIHQMGTQIAVCQTKSHSKSFTQFREGTFFQSHQTPMRPTKRMVAAPNPGSAPSQVLGWK